MALRNNFQPGEQVLASDINSFADAIVQNEHNIFELVLENYFANKITPVNGIFFDGFSDITKANVLGNNLQINASSGQPVVFLPVNSGLMANQEVDIFETSNGNFETKSILSVIISLIVFLTDNFNRANSNTVGGGWTEVEPVAADVSILNNRVSIGPAPSGSNDNNGFAIYQSVVVPPAVALKITLTNVEVFSGHSITGAYQPAYWITYFMDGTFGNGVGVQIHQNSQTSAIVNFIDNGAIKSTTPSFPLNSQSTDNNFELIINTNNTMEFRHWVSPNPRPSSPTFQHTTAFSKVASGTNLFLARKRIVGTDSDVNTTLRIDTVALENMGSDQITFTTNLANSYTTNGKVVRTDNANIITATRKFLFGSLLPFGGTNTNAIDLEESNSQYLQAADSVSLSLTRFFTFEAWVKLESNTGDRTIFMKQGSYRAIIISNGTQIFFETVGGSPRSIVQNITLPVGEWHHIAFAGDTNTGSNAALKIYLDGVVIFNGNYGTNHTMDNTTFPLQIGANAAAVFFDGLIDDVRIWNVQRTDSEIASNYQTELTGSESGLAAYWKFNNSLADATANANTLTNIGGATFPTDTKNITYRSKLQSFQQSMAMVYLWVVRNFSARFNLAAGISAGATTLTLSGDQTNKFANGDTIDIYNSINTTRERKTLTATPTFGSGVTTLTFSAITNAYTTTAFVERVDVIPQVSLVDTGASESFQAMMYQKSIVDFTNLEVEDEYRFLSSTPQEDLTVKLKVSRNDKSLAIYAKRLGVVLNT